MAPEIPENWWDVLVVPRGAPLDVIESSFRDWARLKHPDVEGGSTEAMARLNLAHDAARAEKGAG